MPIYYADTSILVKQHITELGTKWFQAVVALPTTLIVTAELSIVEGCSGLNRRRREGQIDAGNYSALMNDFLHFCRFRYKLVELSAAVLNLACIMIERYPLRSHDAIQLASALGVNQHLVAGQAQALTFLAADNRLLNAAAGEGLQIFNPALSGQV
jgi:predicted nucleic acid-binding protein